ncbi:hypothetical protein D5086_022055 [Populus alba]|uniref:Uncharacterized protein n=1 Tax=Populus alba TaxID=43335 RepID=A0ACC4BFC2_POPAL
MSSDPFFQNNLLACLFQWVATWHRCMALPLLLTVEQGVKGIYSFLLYSPPNLFKEFVLCFLKGLLSHYKKSKLKHIKYKLSPGKILKILSSIVHKIFGEGSLFSPLLFGKYFDPSDAFPLWEFESDVLLSNLRSSGKTNIDWFQTDDAYVLKADLSAGVENNTVQFFVENGKIMEISGQWKPKRDQSKTKDWRSGNWWEHGYVRRLEIPGDADWKDTEAYVSNDMFLEVRIPKSSLVSDTPPAPGKGILAKISDHLVLMKNIEERSQHNPMIVSDIIGQALLKENIGVSCKLIAKSVKQPNISREGIIYIAMLLGLGILYPTH